MEEQSTYHLVTTPDGQAIPARFAPGVHISITIGGQTSTTQPLDITEKEFHHLRDQALTHHVSVDTISGKITMTPKHHPKHNGITPESN